MHQLSMSFLKNYKKEFGGNLLVGKRKDKRPLSTKNPLHLVLRTEHSGVFNPGNRSLENLIRSTAEKFQIKIYDMALNWGHVHIVLKIRDRKDYNRFIRSLTSLIALKIRRKKPEMEQIFSLRPFTRILSWGRDFKNALSYQILNQLESWSLICRKKPEKPAKEPRPDL